MLAQSDIYAEGSNEPKENHPESDFHLMILPFFIVSESFGKSSKVEMDSIKVREPNHKEKSRHHLVQVFIKSRILIWRICMLGFHDSPFSNKKRLKSH